MLPRPPPAARLGFELVAHRCSMPIRSMHLYVDGSFRHAARAGYAITVIARHIDSSFSFQGAPAGNLDCDAELCNANGPMTSNVAEIFGIVWALALAATMPLECDAVLHHGVTAACLLPGPRKQDQRPTTTTCSPASPTASTTTSRPSGICTTHEYVRSHVGHPWRELSHSLLAGAAVADPCCASQLSIAELLCLRGDDGRMTAGPVPWLFLSSLLPAQAEAYPNLEPRARRVQGHLCAAEPSEF